MHDLSPIEWAVRPLKRYAKFSGRASRAEYWWFYLANVVGSIAITLIDKLAGDLQLLNAIYSLALIIPQIAVAVRRLHDTDRSGWWLFVFAIPVALAMLLGIGAGMSGGMMAGMGSMLIVAGLGFAIAAITLLVFMVLPGTEGPNNYGPDPYGPNDELEEVFA